MQQVPIGPVHMCRQEPQLWRSLATSVSQPFAATPSQLSVPAAHAVTTQVPVLQSPTAALGAQAVRQRPQSVIVFSGRSQPVATIPSQSPWSASHRMEQTLAAHTAVALGPVGHAFPQPPQ